MTVETNFTASNGFTAHNEYYRFLKSRLDEAEALNEISDNVALLKPTGSTAVHGAVATHAGEGWDKVAAPLAGQLERIANALEKRNDSAITPRLAWPEQASGGAIYTLRLLSHVRLRLFDTSADDPKLTGATLADEISRHLQQMPQEKLLAPMFELARKLLAGDQALHKEFEALFTPLARSLPVRDAISLRLAELVEVELQVVNALASQAWPLSPDPFDDSATATSARAKK